MFGSTTLQGILEIQGVEVSLKWSEGEGEKEGQRGREEDREGGIEEEKEGRGGGKNINS